MVEPIDVALAQAARLTAAGRPEDAIAHLRPVITAHPDHPGAWCRLAAALLDAGEPQLCLDAAKRAITLGEPVWAHRLASLALTELGRHDEAVISAREAARRDPADWRGHVALAEALAPVDPADAVAAARRAVRIAPGEARTHEVLGGVAARAGDHGLARRAYADALQLDPDNPEVRAAIGDLARERERRPAGVRLGRAQRITLWIGLRRCSVWLAAGSFLLLVAGLPRPSPLLAWFALALLLAVAGVGTLAYLALPRQVRAAPGAVARREPLLGTGVLLVGVGLLFLAVWTVTLAFGGRGMQLLTPVLVSAALAVGVGWYGLWRMRAFARGGGEAG